MNKMQTCALSAAVSKEKYVMRRAESVIIDERAAGRLWLQTCCLFSAALCRKCRSHRIYTLLCRPQSRAHSG